VLSANGSKFLICVLIHNSHSFGQPLIITVVTNVRSQNMKLLVHSCVLVQDGSVCVFVNQEEGSNISQEDLGEGFVALLLLRQAVTYFLFLFFSPDRRVLDLEFPSLEAENAVVALELMTHQQAGRSLVFFLLPNKLNAQQPAAKRHKLTTAEDDDDEGEKKEEDVDDQGESEGMAMDMMDDGLPEFDIQYFASYFDVGVHELMIKDTPRTQVRGRERERERERHMCTLSK
jgi:hypothetical protein